MSKLAAKENDFFGDAIRFVLAGGGNTILTLAIYQICLLFWQHAISYAVSWLVGIIFILIVYPAKVFPGGVNAPWKNVAVVSAYVSIFWIGLWCLNEIVLYGVSERFAIFLVLVISTILNFSIMRILYRILL